MILYTAFFMDHISVVIELAEVGNGINSWMFIIPLLLNAKYSYQTRNKDYYLITLYFLLWSPLYGGLIDVLGIDPGNFLQSDQFWTHVMYSFQWTLLSLDSLILASVAIRAKYGSLRQMPRWIISAISISVLVVIVSWFTTNQVQIVPGNELSGFRFFSTFVGRTTGHSIVFYCFLTTGYYKTDTTTKSRYLWLIASFLQILSYSTAAFFTVFPNILTRFNLLGPYYVFFFTLIILGNLTLNLNHIFFPESVLFTHNQIIRAQKMYNQIQKVQVLPQIGIERMRDYINNLDQDLIDEIT